jgi:hypothetical protein
VLVWPASVRVEVRSLAPLPGSAWASVPDA